MRCPVFLCHCTRNTCLRLEMRNTKQSRATHALRKHNCYEKEQAKYKDGQGKYRAMRSRLDAQARQEAHNNARLDGAARKAA